MFLAPEDRIASLWPQLLGRVKGDFGTLTEMNAERRCLRVGDTQRYLMMVSWGGLLDSMAARSGDEGQTTVVNEIRQLRTLAKYADQGALKPIVEGEGFGMESEDRQRLFKRLVDAATERGIQQEWASRKGLRATPRGYGYGRYIWLHQNIVWFGVNLDQFERSGETPLWVDCRSQLQEKPKEAFGELRIHNDRWAPVNLKRGVEFPEMLDAVVDGLRRIADGLQGTSASVA